MRSSLLEVIRQDYIRTARAKGLRESDGDPASTRCATRCCRSSRSIGALDAVPVRGSVLIEIIFAWPGMGRLDRRRHLQRRTPRSIIACFFVYAILIVVANLLADIALRRGSIRGSGTRDTPLARQGRSRRSRARAPAVRAR